VIHLRTLLLTLALTTALGATGPAAIAVGPARELAASQGTVAVDDCHVTARLVQAGDKVFALISATNHGAESGTFDFHYAAFRTPEASMMERMVPMPERVAQGKCSLTVGADQTVSHTILLREGESQLGALAPEDPMGFGLAPATWRLTVSRNAMDDALGWGAVPPSVADGVHTLGVEQVILAATQFEAPISG